MKCRVCRAAGERRPGQWGQEPPTVRTRLGGTGAGVQEGAGVLLVKQHVLPTAQSAVSRAGPSGTCRGKPQAGPQEVVSSHSAVPTRSFDIRFLILPSWPAAHCWGLCRPTPAPRKQEHNTSGRRISSTRRPWLSQDWALLFPGRVIHSWQSQGPPAHTWGGCVSHDLGHPRPPPGTPCPQQLQGGRGQRGQRAGRWAGTQKPPSPINWKEGWKKEPSAATKERKRNSSTRNNHESNM